MTDKPRILDKALAALDRALLFLERKCGLALLSLIIAVLLLGLAMLYVRPAIAAAYHGIFYAQLASHPFQAENPNAYRLLTPLVAYLVGLRGDRIIILNLLVALVLLAVVYYSSRRQRYAPALSLFVTMMLAFTMPTLFTIHFGGYTDSTSYLLILLMLVCAKRPVLYWLLFLLGLLNRESVVFLLPFFVLWHFYRLRSWPIFLRSALAGPLAAMLLYLLFRAFINSHTVVLHSGNFYFAPLLKDPLYWLRQVADAYPEGVFSVFKLFWVLPLAALFFALRRRQYLMAALVLSPILLSAAQSFIAVDTSRMLAMAFPSLLLAIPVLRKELGDNQLAAVMFALVLLNLAVTQYYVTSDSVQPMYPPCSFVTGCSLQYP